MASYSASTKKILIFGLGDLGARIAQIAIENRTGSRYLLAGHSKAAEQWAQMLGITTGEDVQAMQVDALDVDAITEMLGRFQPDLILHCASLLSPFALSRSKNQAAPAILEGGFALQISAQLPTIRNLMLARRTLGMTCPVVNCSYPDLTHPLLAAEGLAPTCGIGNVAILAMRLSHLIAGAKNNSLHVIAHHAHLVPSLTGNAPAPMVYLAGKRLADKDLLFPTGLQGGPFLNYLAAATLLPILRGLLGKGRVEAHAPGVMGLPGGYPVRIEDGEIHLHLPDAVSLEEAVRFNTQAAEREGIAHLDSEGTLFYTEAAMRAMAPWAPDLAQPLRIGDSLSRFNVLSKLL